MFCVFTMLILIFMNYIFCTFVKIMANQTGTFLKVRNDGEINFVPNQDEATLWKLESSVINPEETHISVFGINSVLTAENDLVKSRPIQNNPNQEFKVIVDDSSNFQLLFKELNFVDADDKHLFLRNDTFIPAGFTFFIKDMLEKPVKPTTDVIQSDPSGNIIGKGTSIPVDKDKYKFNLYTLSSLAQKTGIDYSNFEKITEADPDDLINDPYFLKHPRKYLRNNFTPAVANELENKYKSAIHYLESNHHNLNDCIQRNALRRMLKADNGENRIECNENGCFEELEDTSSEFIDEECCHTSDYHFSLAQAMKNRIEFDRRMREYELRERERLKGDNENGTELRKTFINSEENRVRKLNKKYPFERAHLQGPGDYLRRIIGKKLSGYNIDDDPEIIKVINKGSDDPKARGITDNRLLYAYNQDEQQDEMQNDQFNVCLKFSKLISESQHDTRIHRCPRLLY